jgi:hypothetical protein
MNFHKVAVTLAMAVTVCLPAAVYAAPTTSIHAPVHALFSTPHKVSLTLRNDGQESLKLKAGDQELTLKPGEDATVKVLDGEKVIAETASANHTAGEVIVTASNELNGATVRIK